MNADELELIDLFAPTTQTTPGGCPFERFEDKLPEIGGRDTTFNNSCFVEVEAVDINDYHVVDVRGEAEYQQGHIKNSLNIPLHQIANKRFLKNKNLLLVNNGLPQFEMGQFCQILADKGFNKIKVLRGGIHNWQSQGLALTGIGHQQHTDVVQLEDFVMDYDNNLIQVVNVKTDDKQAQRIVSDAKLIALDNQQITLKQQFESLMAANGDAHKQIVVILSEDDYLSSKNLLKGAVLKDIYYVLADQKKLTRFKQTRKTINQARVDGPRAQQCGS